MCHSVGGVIIFLRLRTASCPACVCFCFFHIFLYFKTYCALLLLPTSTSCWSRQLHTPSYWIYKSPQITSGMEMECKRKANYFLVSLAWIRVHVACVCLCRPWSTSSLSSSDVSLYACFPSFKLYSFYHSFQLSVKRTTSWFLLHAIVKQTSSSSLWHGSVCTSKLVWAFMISVIARFFSHLRPQRVEAGNCTRPPIEFTTHLMLLFHLFVLFKHVAVDWFFVLF